MNSPGEGTVRIVLDDASITSSTSAPFVVLAADEVVVVLADGSSNTLADAQTYTYPAGADEPNAALFSAADLTIAGSGALTVTGNANDAIASKDGLVIASGTITVRAKDDGIRGKDYVIVDGGEVTVTAGGDGVKADNAEEADRGYVALLGGTLEVTSGGDGVDAATDAIVGAGALTVHAGGGAGAQVAPDASAKGVKGAVSVVVGGGTITVDSADDALHSDSAVTVIDGTLSLRTGDDGVHADATLVVSGGSIRVAEAYEGLESAVITVSAGTLDLTTSDDAVNVSGGIDASGMRGPAGGGPDSFSDNGTRKLTVTGGTLTMSSGGDGVDVAGSVTITGGTLVVSGPTSNGNSALDVDGTFLVEGGTLLAAGSSGMAVAPSTQSAQGWVSATLTQAVPAGTVVHVVAGDGSVVASYTAAKPFTSLVYSADGITPGETYAVYTGGSAGEGSTGGLSGAGSVDGATEIARVTAGQHAAGRRGGMRP